MSIPTRARLVVALLVATAGLALPGCGPGGGGGTGEGHGIVRGLDAEAGQVTLEHGEIPGMMKGMTMTFDVADPAQLSGLAPGQAVDFELKEEDGRYVVTAIAASP